MLTSIIDSSPHRARRSAARLAWVALTITLALALAQPASAVLIQNVTVTAEPFGNQPPRVAPESICSGEVVEVAVTTQHPVDPAQRVAVTIDAYPGERRFLQFRGVPGPRFVTIGAATEDGLFDRQQVEIKIAECELSALPAVRSRPNPYHPGRVDFRIEAFGSLATDNPDFHIDFGDGTVAEAVVSGFLSHDYSDSLDGQQPYHSFVVTVSDQPIVGGQTAPGALVRRATATLVDAYYFAKRKGILQPPARTSRVFEARGGDLVGSYQIRNLEPQPLLLEHATLEQLACDPTVAPVRVIVPPSDIVFQGGYGLALDDPRLWDDPEFVAAMGLKGELEWIPEDAWVVPPQAGSGSPDPDFSGRPAPHVAAKSAPTPAPIFPPLPSPPSGASGAVVLPALHTHQGYLTLPAATVPSWVCAVAYHLIGHTENGERAYVSLYFETRENPSLVAEVTDPTLAGVLLELMQRGLISNPTEITQEEIYMLEERGLVRRTESGWEVLR